jgi:hypothetical protein
MTPDLSQILKPATRMAELHSHLTCKSSPHHLSTFLVLGATQSKVSTASASAASHALQQRGVIPLLTGLLRGFSALDVKKHVDAYRV